MQILDYPYGVWKVKLNKKIIKTNFAPEAIGVYSQGVQVGEYIYTSGQIALDPKSGKLKTGSFKIEVHQVLSNIDAILKKGGGSLDSIIKLTVYLTDLNNFSIVNEIFAEYFPDNPPARSAMQISALPMDANIEIEAIGVSK